MSMAEMETLAFRDREEAATLTVFIETRPRRDNDTSRDRDVETTNPVESRHMDYGVVPLPSGV